MEKQFLRILSVMSVLFYGVVFLMEKRLEPAINSYAFSLVRSIHLQNNLKKNLAPSSITFIKKIDLPLYDVMAIDTDGTMFFVSLKSQIYCIEPQGIDRMVDLIDAFSYRDTEKQLLIIAYADTHDDKSNIFMHHCSSKATVTIKTKEKVSIVQTEHNNLIALFKKQSKSYEFSPMWFPSVNPEHKRFSKKGFIQIKPLTLGFHPSLDIKKDELVCPHHKIKQLQILADQFDLTDVDSKLLDENQQLKTITCYHLLNDKLYCAHGQYMSEWKVKK